MTWQMITNGVEAFTPATSRLIEIASEIIPYILYIAIACFGIQICFIAVKMIIRRFNKKTDKVFNYYELTSKRAWLNKKTWYYDFYLYYNKIKRKKPKRSNRWK